MNKIQKIAATFLFSGFLFISIGTPFVFAASNNILKTPNIAGTSEDKSLVTCDGTKNKECGVTEFIELIQKILNLIFAFAAFIAAAMFMFAGFLMLTSLGDMSKITQAKEIFRRVIIGFLIMFCSFLIVQQVLKKIVLSPEATTIIGKIINLN